MRKHISVILSAIASVILIFVLLFTAVEIAKARKAGAAA